MVKNCSEKEETEEGVMMGKRNPRIGDVVMIPIVGRGILTEGVRGNKFKILFPEKKKSVFLPRDKVSVSKNKVWEIKRLVQVT